MSISEESVLRNNLAVAEAAKRAAKADAKRIRKELAAARNAPSVNSLPDGSVVYFEKEEPDFKRPGAHLIRLSYVAIKKDAAWWISRARMEYGEFSRFLEGVVGEVQVVETFAALSRVAGTARSGAPMNTVDLQEQRRIQEQMARAARAERPPLKRYPRLVISTLEQASVIQESFSNSQRIYYLWLVLANAIAYVQQEPISELIESQQRLRRRLGLSYHQRSSGSRYNEIRSWMQELVK